MAMTLDPAVIDGLKRMFAGNTQGLGQLVQQEATQNNPDFVKAIALQQLKDQEAAVKRQQALNNPEQPTVVAQRENELMQRTAQEVAQQSAMAAQQKARQQQMSMQRMMAGAADPRAAGIGNLPMGAMRMAGGGIVAFEDGGDVTFEKLAKDVDKALLLGASQEDLASLVMRAGYDPAMFGLDAPMMGGGPRPAPEAPQAPAPRQAPGPDSETGFYGGAMDTDPVLKALGVSDTEEGPTFRFDMPTADFYGRGMDTDPLLKALGAETVAARTGLMGDRPSGTAPVGKGMMGRSSTAARTVKAEDTDDGPTFRFDMPDANFYGGAMDTDPYLAEREELQARPVSGLMAGPAGRPAGREAPRGSGLQGARPSGTAPVGKGMSGRSVEAAKAAEAARSQPDTPPGAQNVADINISPEDTDLFAALGLPADALRGRDEDVAAALGLGDIADDDVIGASLAASGQGLGSLRQPPSITAPEFKEPESMALRRTAASDLITKGAGFDPTKTFEEQQKILRGTQKDGTDRFTGARQRAEDIKAAAAVDPRARSMRNFIETLSAAAGASTPGIGLARAGITSVNVARRGEQEEVKRLQDFDNAISKIEAAELGLDESALERAADLQAIAANQVIAGNELLTSLTDTEQERLTAEARAKLDVELSDRDSYWSGVDAELKAEQNALLRDRNNFDALQSAMEWSTETINTSIATAVDEVRSSPEYQRLMFTAQSGDPNSKKAQEARRDMEDMEIAAEQKAIVGLKSLGVYDFQNQVRTLQTKQVTSLASSI